MKERKIREIEYSRKFLKSANKIPKNIQAKVEDKEIIFKKNAFDSRLDTHKLHGKDREHWAYSIDNKYRIKFLFLDDNTALYLDIGVHDEVY